MLRKIAVLTTLRCDLRCAHCLRGYPKERPDFPLDLAERLLAEARSFGARHVALTGGEPHLHPEFEHLVEMIVEAGYTWSFVSHGGRTEPYEGLMTRYHEQLTHASLSIDGASAATHDAIRRKAGAFERVTAAARHYVSLGFRVQVGASLNQCNKDELEDMVRLAEELGAYAFTGAGTIPTPWNAELQLDDAERVELFQRLMAMRDQVDLRVRYVSSLFTSGGVHFCNNVRLRELAFSPRGELMFCCDTYGDGAVVGSLAEKPLGELIKRWLAHAAALQQHRADRIMRGQIGPGFDTCAFCNHYFAEHIPLLVRT